MEKKEAQWNLPKEEGEQGTIISQSGDGRHRRCLSALEGRGGVLGSVSVMLEILPVVKSEEETDDNVQYEW